MKIRRLRAAKPVVEVAKTGRAATSCAIKLEFTDNLIPEIMTDIIYAWRKLGNPWSSVLEIGLSATAPRNNLNLENEVGNSDAVAALYFLGYMEVQRYVAPNRVSQCRQYRLSKKGIEAGDYISSKIGDTVKPIGVGSRSETLICDVCEGQGWKDPSETICEKCNGTGEITKRRTKINLEEPELIRQQKEINEMIALNARKNTSSRETPKQSPLASDLDCGDCLGTGVDEDGNDCTACNGTGTIPKPTRRTRVKRV